MSVERPAVKLVAERVVDWGGDYLLVYRSCREVVERRRVESMAYRGGLWTVVARVPWYLYISHLAPENDFPMGELLHGLEYLDQNHCSVWDVEVPFRRYYEFRNDLILVEDVHGNLYMRRGGRYHLSPYWERFRSQLRPYPEVPEGVVCGHYYRFKLGRIVGREGNWYVFVLEDGSRVRAWKDPIVPARFCVPQSV